VLETHPTWISEGYIYGYYDLQNVVYQAGDRFVIQGGFLRGAEAGAATFMLRANYGEYPQCGEFGCSQEFSFFDSYDGQTRSLRVTLPDDAIGQRINAVMLIVQAGESSAQDWAVWITARLERP
jgi:hypothetical protein